MFNIEDATDWHDRAECRPNNGHPPDLWFPHPSDTAGTKAAQAICATCTVRNECLEDAIETGSEGIRGGLTGYRRRARKQRDGHIAGTCASCGADTSRKSAKRCLTCYRAHRKGLIK